VLGWGLRPLQMEQAYATVFQAYVLRFGIIVSCGVVFSQLFRGETLEKTLHFYLLAPVRREILAIGKYVAACAATITLFGVSTIGAHLLLFFLDAERLTSLARYLGAAALACASYGAVFIVLGVFLKNASLPGVMLLGWEYASVALPASLQRLSIVYYLQPLLPSQIRRGPFAVITDPPAVWLAVPLLLIFSAALVAVAAWRVRRLEVTYSAD
jgi:ABC-type transport system involved in multi-copper enzyme maturation permease subunit